MKAAAVAVVVVAVVGRVVVLLVGRHCSRSRHRRNCRRRCSCCRLADNSGING